MEPEAAVAGSTVQRSRRSPSRAPAKPATPNPRPHGRCAVVTRDERAPGAAWQPQARRAGDAVGLTIHSRGRAAAQGSPSRCAVIPPLINGGGCAASLVNQWKRLRRSEYLGDRMGDASMGNGADGPAGPWTGTLVACAVTVVPGVAVGHLCAGVPTAVLTKLAMISRHDLPRRSAR